jgi:hypothetical protein
MKIVGVLGIVALFVAQTAMAQPSAIRGPRPGGGSALLNDLIFPCQATCFNNESTCSATAQSTALTAIQGACSSDITAAQTACDTTSYSSACRTAVGTLATCAKSELQTYRSAVGTCNQTLHTCLDACDMAPSAD